MKLGTTELLLILAVVIVIFGPTQLPKLSRMFGKSVKNFRDSVADDEDKPSDSSGASDK